MIITNFEQACDLAGIPVSIGQKMSFVLANYARNGFISQLQASTAVTYLKAKHPPTLYAPKLRFCSAKTDKSGLTMGFASLMGSGPVITAGTSNLLQLTQSSSDTDESQMEALAELNEKFQKKQRSNGTNTDYEFCLAPFRCEAEYIRNLIVSSGNVAELKFEGDSITIKCLSRDEVFCIGVPRGIDKQSLFDYLQTGEGELQDTQLQFRHAITKKELNVLHLTNSVRRWPVISDNDLHLLDSGYDDPELKQIVDLSTAENRHACLETLRGLMESVDGESDIYTRQIFDYMNVSQFEEFVLTRDLGRIALDALVLLYWLEEATNPTFKFQHSLFQHGDTGHIPDDYGKKAHSGSYSSSSSPLGNLSHTYFPGVGSRLTGAANETKITVIFPGDKAIFVSGIIDITFFYRAMELLGWQCPQLELWRHQYDHYASMMNPQLEPPEADSDSDDSEADLFYEKLFDMLMVLSKLPSCPHAKHLPDATGRNAYLGKLIEDEIIRVSPEANSSHGPRLVFY